MGPNFLGIGTYRAGTTWLYDALKDHPDIFLTDEKELMFFDRHYKRGFGWYFNLFRGTKGEKFIGDISPTYLYSDEAPQRIYAYSKNIKLIASLRNPPDQIFSLYNLWRRRGYTNKDIAAVLEEGELLQNVLYWKRLSKYLEYFDKDQLLIIFFEDLRRDPVAYLKQVYSFLGVPEWFSEDIYKKSNAARTPKSELLERSTAKAGDWLHRMGLLGLKSFLKKIKIVEALNSINTADSKKSDKLPDDLRQRINLFVEGDKKKLEEHVGRNLSFWN